MHLAPSNQGTLPTAGISKIVLDCSCPLDSVSLKSWSLAGWPYLTTEEVGEFCDGGSHDAMHSILVGQPDHVEVQLQQLM